MDGEALRAARLRDLATLLVQIRARHAGVRSLLLAVGPGGVAVYPSEREMPLWPNEGRELLDLDDEPYSLPSIDHGTERDAFAPFFPTQGDEHDRGPYAVARFCGDETVEVERLERLPPVPILDEARARSLVTEPNPGELTLIDPSDDLLATLAAAPWWPTLGRLTLLWPADYSFWPWRDDYLVSTMVTGFHEDARPVGWHLMLDGATRGFSVALVAFYGGSDLGMLARLLESWFLTEPVMLVPTRFYQPTPADAEWLTMRSKKQVVVIDDHWRTFVRPGPETQPASIEPENDPPPYAASDCTVFVIYAVPGRHADVQPGQPTLVLADADELLAHFGRFEAPYPLELSGEQLIDRLQTIRDEWRPLAFHDEMVTQIMTFASQHRGSSFICVLEPPAIAGAGTAIDLMGP